jgi:hypothetical protein
MPLLVWLTRGGHKDKLPTEAPERLLDLLAWVIQQWDAGVQNIEIPVGRSAVRFVRRDDSSTRIYWQPRNEVMERSGRKYTPDEILPHVWGNAPRLDLDGGPVKVHTLRMLTFKKDGITCRQCGIVGQYFVKERQRSHGENFHLNLYAVDRFGVELMMTHDHVVARCLGGADDLSNTQTLCQACNVLKSVVEQNALEATDSDETGEDE